MSKTAQRKKAFHRLGIEDAEKLNPTMRFASHRFLSYYKKGFTDRIKLEEGKINGYVFNKRCANVR